MSKRLTKEQFIEKSRKVHGDKYDYSKVEYINNSTKVCIICPIHGEFWQTPANHMNGQDCPECSGRGNTTESIIEKFKKIHGDKYDYSKVIFERVDKKVCIICPIHGEFWQEPRLHLKGCGCKYCAGKDMTTEEFIRRAREVHGDKYDYSKVKFITNKTKVCIICPIHGEFWQEPSNHVNGKNGCPKCGYNNIHNKRKYTNEWFIEKARAIHGDKYDYSKVEYYNIDTPVCIICPIHGEFWQTPYHHLRRKQGCPICKQSHMENDISNFLNKNNIRFIPQCDNKTIEWLKRQSLDFYLPDYNVAIECQGEQHFQPVEHFGGEKKLETMRKLDIKKYKLCEEHNIKLYYFSDVNVDFPYHVYKNREILLKEIKNNYGTTDSK